MKNASSNPGSRVRKFPVPTKNPFTWLYFFVSCPNYTYEVTVAYTFTAMRQRKICFTIDFLFLGWNLGWLLHHDAVFARCVVHKHFTPSGSVFGYCVKLLASCLAVALYTLLGFIQMTVWAKGKHKAYSREFKDYPSLRMAIVPLIL